jgi:hypothetical protein
MCCGQKRSTLQSNLPPTSARTSGSSLRLVKGSEIRVRGPVSGRYYDFSGSRPVTVDPKDIPALLGTRHFERA